VTLEC